MTRWDAHLSALVEDRYPALVAYATMLTGGQLAAAEDLVQDAIVRTHAHGRGFHDPKHAENYVRRAIGTTFIDAHRRKTRTAKAYARLAEPGSMPGPEADVARTADVTDALARLAPRPRACIVLRFYDDLSVPQIASRLGLAEGTVKRYLSDAAALLAAALDTTIDSRETAPISPR